MSAARDALVEAREAAERAVAELATEYLVSRVSGSAADVEEHLDALSAALDAHGALVVAVEQADEVSS